MLDEEMKHLIESNTIGCVSTVNKDGRPAVSPKGTFLVVDDTTLAFSNIRSPGTVANLEESAFAEVAFIDVLRRTGLRVRGRTTYTLIDKAGRDVATRFKDTWPDLFPIMHGVVSINVEHAELLSSPSYDVGSKEKELVEHWIKQYAESVGYVATKK